MTYHETEQQRLDRLAILKGRGRTTRAEELRKLQEDGAHYVGMPAALPLGGTTAPAKDDQ